MGSRERRGQREEETEDPSFSLSAMKIYPTNFLLSAMITLVKEKKM